MTNAAVAVSAVATKTRVGRKSFEMTNEYRVKLMTAIKNGATRTEHIGVPNWHLSMIHHEGLIDFVPGVKTEKGRGRAKKMWVLTSKGKSFLGLQLANEARRQKRIAAHQAALEAQGETEEPEAIQEDETPAPEAELEAAPEVEAQAEPETAEAEAEIELTA